MSTHSAAPMTGPWGALVEQWLTECYINRDRSPGTIELRRYQLARLVRWAGERSLWDLDADDLIAFISQTGMANTRVATRSGVRSFYQWAYRRTLIDRDLVGDIPKAPAPQPRPRPVPNDVYLQLVGELNDPLLRTAIRLAGELGLRRGEVAALHRDHLIEDEDGYWLRFIGKGDKERMIPCPDDLAADVLDLIESTPGDYAFPARMGNPRTGVIYRPDDHLTPHWIGTLVARVLPEGYTMHKLRHRAGTEAYRRSGNDIYLASTLLGHSSVTTTQVYVKPDMSRLRAVVSGEAVQ